jgi:uncharacterized protein
VLRPEGEASLYLLGSVHLRRRTTLRLPAAVDNAFARSDELVLEIDFSTQTPAEAERLAHRYAFIEPPASLRDRVSAETLAALERYLEVRGEPLALHLQLEPWFLATQLYVRELARIGLDPEYGVDRHFADRAGRKPVLGLETAESQLALMDALPRDVQELMLIDTLARSADLREEAESLVSAWERGDDAQLVRIVFRPLRESAQYDVFYERVMYGRNEAMAQRLASLSRDGKLRFVVVGAAHLVGGRGIPSLLRDYGFSVQKVR